MPNLPSTPFATSLILGDPNPFTVFNFTLAGANLLVPGTVIQFAADNGQTFLVTVPSQPLFGQTLTLALPASQVTITYASGGPANPATPPSLGADIIDFEGDEGNEGDEGDEGDEGLPVPNDFIVGGTAADDEINVLYTGDPDGDRIDDQDNQLLNDNDIVRAGAGNDTVQSGLGDDEVFGEAGDDLLAGNDGNDLVDGGTGDDALQGFSGNDTVIGGDGRDQLFGGTGNDSLEGGANGDVIYADRDLVFDPVSVPPSQQGNDFLSGGGGNDVLIGEGGDDLIDGGAENDILIGDSPDTVGPNLIVNGSFEDDGIAPNQPFGAVIRDLTGWSDRPLTFGPTNVELVFDGATDGTYGLDLESFTNLEVRQDVPGLNKDQLYRLDFDITNLNDPTNGLQLFFGNELIDTLNFDDPEAATFTYYVVGGSGNGTDELKFVSTGTINGIGAYLDNVRLAAIDGSAVPGDNTLLGEDGDDYALGGAGNDSIRGGTGDDTLVGGEGVDLVSGDAGEDVIQGGGGADILSGGDGRDAIFGDNPEDGPQIPTANQGNDNIDGGAGDDFLVGDGGADTITGGADDDQIYGDDVTFGPNLIVNGSFETLFTPNTATSFGANAVGAPGWNDNATSINYFFEGATDGVLGINFGGASIFGTPVGLVISQAVSGIEDGKTYRLQFDLENATPNSGGSSIQVEWGGEVLPQPDVFALGSVDSPTYFVKGGSGNGDNLLTFRNVGPNSDGTILDNVRLEEVIVGSGTGDDVLSGNDGDDIIYGGEGQDTITGDAGNDSLFGDGGADSISGGVGHDFINGGSGNDVLSGDDNNDTIFGGDGSDDIDGGVGDDFLDGGADNDTLSGGDGIDTIAGGLGNDSIEGGIGNDILTGGDGIDVIDGGDGNDTIQGGVGADFIDGGAGNDSISGGDGIDVVDAGDGDDTIDGGAGNDVLTGGDGHDIFVENSGNGADIITDFGIGNTGSLTDGDQTNNDFIDLSAFYNPFTLSQVNNADTDPSNDFFSALNMLREDIDDGRIDGIIDGIDYSALIGGVDIQIQRGGVNLGEDGPGDDDDNDDDFTYDTTNVVCFTPGTVICTISGTVAVENLKVGDRVFTMDNGFQDIRWIGKKWISEAALSAQPRLRPIRIKAGAIGHGLPLSDLVVSPQHRILVRSKLAERMFGSLEVLIPAKKLLGIDGVELDTGRKGVTYIHFACSSHEVVFANGLRAETLHLGKQALSTMSDASREELSTIFPEIVEPDFEPLLARTVPKRGHAIRKFVERARKNGVAVVE